MSAHPDEPTDERLIQATLTGDDGAFAALVGRYKSRAFSIAGRFARNDYELDDICQDAFIRVYHNLAKFRGEAPFEHWFSRIVVRTCYDALRKTQRDRKNVSLDGIDIGAEDNVNAERAREVLDFALARLSAEERLAITLLELEEISVRDVAALTGWSESNVKVRAHRARNALKRVLEASHER